MKITKAPGEKQVGEMDEVYDVSRRRFFQLAGGIAGAGVLLSACHPRTGPTDIYIGSGDTALLNFLYILEQLEAAFYTQAVATPYYGLTNLESLCLTDVRDQEIAHRNFLKALLGKNAITNILPNFTNITFADRTNFLTNAAIIEDIVVSGFTGAAGLFVDQSYPNTFSKIITVEARHSAYFRDILTHNSFSDGVISTTGLDQAITPSTVLAAAQQFIQTRFDSTKLPNF
jgi:Ferritin-like domain